MRTLKLIVSYDGTEYVGWQSQSRGRTLQDTFEAAILQITGETLRVVASGRTDAGVHALAQVVSFTTACPHSLETLRRAFNANLPQDMAVLSIVEVPAGFHAIRDAVRKRYRYQLRDGRIPDVFARRFAWHVYHDLDSAAMHRAAQSLIGTHDFAAFQSAGAERESTIRTIYEATVIRGAGEGRGATAGQGGHSPSEYHTANLITFTIEADGFLYNMVRTLVGSLVQIGRRLQPDTWLTELIAARDRRIAGQTAPPQGLFLVEVKYDE